jgi:hypothetical protein
MRDRDVRQALLAHLAELHAGDPDTRIVEEMGVWCGTARIDVAVVNGELCGFELKSERDTLERLPLQAEVYGLVFDRLSLVTTERHLKKADTIVPRWWGTYIVQQEFGGLTKIRRARAPQLNPRRDPVILAQLLWRSEALDLLNQHSLVAGYRSKSAKALHERLATGLPLKDLALGVRAALKVRTSWLGQVSPDPVQMTVNPNTNPSL